MTQRTSSLAVAVAMLSMTLAAPALAQRDNVIAEARAAGLVGEQADGYLGFDSGAQISADLRGREEQNNMRRRAADTERGAGASASVAEIAAARTWKWTQLGRLAGPLAKPARNAQASASAISRT